MSLLYRLPARVWFLSTVSWARRAGCESRSASWVSPHGRDTDGRCGALTWGSLREQKPPSLPGTDSDKLLVRSWECWAQPHKDPVVGPLKAQHTHLASHRHAGRSLRRAQEAGTCWPGQGSPARTPCPQQLPGTAECTEHCRLGSLYGSVVNVFTLSPRLGLSRSSILF